jgi:hypothetical protein
MANLKLDLKNKIGNDKYYEELELIRLAQDPNINYKEKIFAMQLNLQSLAVLNAELGLVEQYFQEPVPQAAPANVPQGAPVQGAPAGQVHQGQTHGE